MKKLLFLSVCFILVILVSGCRTEYERYYYLYENNTAVLLVVGEWYLMSDNMPDNYGNPVSSNGGYNLVRILSVTKQKSRITLQVEFIVDSLTVMPKSLCDVEIVLQNPKQKVTYTYLIAPHMRYNRDFIFIPLMRCDKP